MVSRRALLFAALGVSTAGTAHAYDAHYTHAWLTRKAIERLVEAYPGRYDALLAHEDDVIAGVRDEDNFIADGDTDPTTMRVMRHFYRPTDEKGLTYGGREFPSSYDWSAIGNETNAWDWSDGLERGRQGDAAGAYKTLGHIVHQIQDATVPAHAHLDDHGPPYGDDYESWCAARMTDDVTDNLPLPPPGAAIPERLDRWDVWQAAAWAGYKRNLYAGDLSDPERPYGRIAEMFPDLGWSFFAETWTIDSPDVGELGRDFREELPGLYYFENAEHAAAIDLAGFDPDGEPGRGAFAPNTGGASMTELMARDLIPIAILESAAMMKLYLDELDAITPLVEPEPQPAAAATGCRAATGATPRHPMAGVLALAAAVLFRFSSRSLRRTRRK